MAASGRLGRRIDRNRESLMLGLESPIPTGFESVVAGVEAPEMRDDRLVGAPGQGEVAGLVTGRGARAGVLRSP